LNYKKIFSDWVIPIVAAIIIAILIKKLLFYQIVVPSGSMYPTIKIGNKIIVTRIYKMENLKRGDIIVFNSTELKTRLIKRLIGLPGDEIVIKDKGKVFINGKKIEETYVVYPENLDEKFKVPKNKYLFFGDNRANSFDARKWGNPYIDSNDIEGKAQFIVYPFKRFGKFVTGKDALNY